MLFSLGRRIVYERETRTRKPTPKPDALSQWRTMEVQRKPRHMNGEFQSDEREEEEEEHKAHWSEASQPRQG